ncbi:MAG TPA: hypothetical protein VFK44_01290 [Bacillales bacterium]|nr:hypothetical protein [Bacillales bacterium]
MSSAIRRAKAEDREPLADFASASGVPADEIREQYEKFYIMETEQGQWMATVAIEQRGDNAMLRMLVINPTKCGMEEMVRFLHEILAVVQQRNFRKLYLVTPSPEIFRPFGFSPVQDQQIPEPLQSGISESGEDTVPMARSF